MGPVEIVRALGMTPYFPENHAALIGASRQTGKYIPRALAEGFSQFASSAMTSDIGAMLVGDSPLVSLHGTGGPPRPDVVVYNTNNGHGLIRWFEYYGRHFGVPVLGLHPPSSLHEINQVETDAVVQQTLRLVSHLETIAGHRLDSDRLAEVVSLSAQAAEQWMEILRLACNVPSPLTFFDLLIHMAPMVVLRGTPEAVEYYRILRAELEQRVANHQAAVPGEMLRVYWEGPPIWCALRPLARLFLSHRVAIVAATYPRTFALQGLDPANPIESTAIAYAGIFPNRSDDYKANFLSSQFKDFAVDGVIYHEGRTAPEDSNVRYGLGARLDRETGLPSIVIEADSHDLRLVPMEQIARRLEEFIELHDGASGTARGAARPDRGRGER
jgi:benzoyl-CoA reductase/2-hydroxyglutaryl-CoA dehydratase subunit BcrC/BadD/HgdB